MVSIPGSFRGLEEGTLGNPIDYDPPPETASTTLSADTVDSLVDGAMTPSSPADAGSFTVDSATGFTTPVASTLADAIETGDNTVELVDASSFETAGVFKVGTERISWASKSGNFLLNVRRGALGTTEAAEHAIGAAARQGEVAIVEREPIVYHTLAGAVLGDILREAPVAHDDDAVCAVSADISVASVAGLGEPGRIEVGSEVISYRTITGTTLEGVARGVDGTTVEAHLSAAAVAALAYPRLSSSIESGARRARPLFLPNTSGGALARGELVGWSSLAGAGGGFDAVLEGEPAIGILSQATNDDAWGQIQAVGVASMLLDAADPEEPGPGEPVFARSSTSLKSLENADYGDEAIGYCLRVHDFDYDGTTVLSPKRVDFVMVSQVATPLTFGKSPTVSVASYVTQAGSQSIAVAAGFVTLVLATTIREDSVFEIGGTTANEVDINFTGWLRVNYSAFARCDATGTLRGENQWQALLDGVSIPGSKRGSYHRCVTTASILGRNSVAGEMVIAVTSGQALRLECDPIGVAALVLDVALTLTRVDGP